MPELAFDSRAPASAARERLAAALLCAEVGHDLAGPIRFLGDIVRGLARGEAPSEEEIAIAREELARLERLVARVRKGRSEAVVLAATSLDTLVARAIEASHTDLASRNIVPRVDVAPGLRVEADVDLAALGVAELVRNAAAAAPVGGEVCVEARACGVGIALDVVDDGPGVDDAARTTLFEPLAALRAGGRGLGLAVAVRAARVHGWNIEYAREAGRSRFRIEMQGNA
jgi:signal transduction histidine kinase